MKVVRCPECGNRLDSNYCPMCMKRVPVYVPPSSRKKTNWRQRAYSGPVGKEDGHECIDFDEVAQSRHKPEKTAPVFRQKTDKKKSTRTASIVLSVIFLVIPLLTSIFEWISDAAAPEPEYYYEEIYIPAGKDEAAQMPALSKAQPLFGGDGVMVTAESVGLLYDDPAIEVLIQNSSEQDITVSTSYLCVNGFMFSSGGLYCDVGEGEFLTEYIRLNSYELEELGIETVAQVDVAVDVYDSEDYTQLSDSQERISLELDVPADFVQKVDDAGQEIFNQDGLRLVYQGVELYEDEITLFLYAENTSDKTLMLSNSALMVDGQEVDGFLWCQLWPGTRAKDSVYLYEVDPSVDLTRRVPVVLELCVEDAENWDRNTYTIELDL